ncbi:MAG: hypothetical protein LBV33_02695 [Lachnospiraceae bacterium]|jgi:hypothetical protein|nr:hypothetical protein [Lachnospiraceae bacterium]
MAHKIRQDRTGAHRKRKGNLLGVLMVISSCFLCSCTAGDNLPDEARDTSLDVQNEGEVISDGGSATTGSIESSDDQDAIEENDDQEAVDEAGGSLNTDEGDDNLNQLEMNLTQADDGGFDVVILNNSDKEIMAGEDYRIERLNGDEWEEIPLSVVWYSVGIIIPAGESHSFHYDRDDVINFEEGVHYRIVKAVYLEQDKIELSCAIQ